MNCLTLQFRRVFVQIVKDLAREKKEKEKEGKRASVLYVIFVYLLKDRCLKEVNIGDLLNKIRVFLNECNNAGINITQL